MQQTSKTVPGSPAAAAASDGGDDPRDRLVQDRLENSGRVGRFLYGLFPAVAIPAYMVLWQGNIGTMLAFWMQFTAEGYFVYLLTGSNSMLAIVGMARSLPMVFVAPILGTLADRVDRLTMLVAAQAAGAIVAAIVAALIFLDLIEAWHLVVGALLGGVAIAANFPARQALVMSIVGRKYMMNAVALHTTSIGATRILGPPVAGAAAGAGQRRLVLRLDRGADRPGRSLHPPHQGAEGRVAQPAGLLRARHPGRLRLRLNQPAAAAGGDYRGRYLGPFYSHYQFIPAIARDVLLSPEAGLATLSAASGAGGLIGALVASRLDHIRRKGLLLFAGSMLFGARSWSLPRPTGCRWPR